MGTSKSGAASAAPIPAACALSTHPDDCLCHLECNIDQNVQAVRGVLIIAISRVQTGLGSLAHTRLMYEEEWQE